MTIALVVLGVVVYVGIGAAMAHRADDVNDMPDGPLVAFVFFCWPAFLVGLAAYRMGDKIARKII